MEDDKNRAGSQAALDTAYLNSDSAPALAPVNLEAHPALQQAKEVGDTVGKRPHNANKAQEYGEQAAEPPVGETVEAASPLVSTSSLSEANDTGKTGAPVAPGTCQSGGNLEGHRCDATGQRLTTNQGVPISDNQHSLKAGLRGPALLKDFVLREKLTHFDHERIPERIVHARGSAAHGYFESYGDHSELTAAALLSEKGKKTPVFVRFSTVAGERGSKDTARDARGFAVKFYTEEGNWDLVGNNIPVFFIQDAMKFPDLVHAVKAEPHHGMPQAASAHDTFWDFVTLMPESAHMLMWIMSDHGIPRSYRMMKGFAVHTFRFINREGRASLVKFHWTPKQGTHALVWDEAVKISGADPDYHRRDLWEAIEAGEYPEWELGVQVFTEEQAEQFSFDVLDATKIIPEELVPITPLGRMVLNRNPDNFFAETEQVAFCTAHIVPGIDFTNDPLLAGRIHSYVDTQLSRLGGPNFHEIPINAPVAPVHNNQRDGMHRQTINRGRAAYEPNSLGGGCPFQAGGAGFVSFPEPVAADELRGKPEKFAEHYNQARLFYASQAPHEQKHIADAFSFELSKLTVPAIRQRAVALLRNVDETLARTVADKLGMRDLPEPLPLATAQTYPPEVQSSRGLSLLAHPGEVGIRTRKVAIICAAGTDDAEVQAIAKPLMEQGAVVRLVGPHVGLIQACVGELDLDASFANSPGPLFDALVVAPGSEAIKALSSNGQALEFVKEQFRHCKPMLAIGEARDLLKAAGIPLDKPDKGLVLASQADDKALRQFVSALEAHRHPERETDPPKV